MLKKLRIKYTALYLFLFSSVILHAQANEGQTDYSFITIITIAILLGVWALIALSDNLMQIEAKKSGLDTAKKNYGVFPSVRDIFAPKKPGYTANHPVHFLKKGADIKLAGAPEAKWLNKSAQRFAVQPHLFHAMSPIPKLEVEIGTEVLAGDVLFYDKLRPEIKYVSPVSGEVVDIVRGPKRAIHQVVILADKEIKYKSFKAPKLDAGFDKIQQFLQESGGWTLINQRPFDIVPNVGDRPRDVFVSTFDTAPCAPDSAFVIQGREADFQMGIDVLAALTDGKVYLGLDGRNPNTAPPAAFTQATNAEKHYFSGKHPIGNVGVQIHHIAPIKSGDKVWTLHVQDVISLGTLFRDGKFDASRTVAVTGHKAGSTGYVKTYIGANVSELLAGQDLANTRIIAGDVLTGRRLDDTAAYLGHHDDQISVIEEGDKYELFGWLLPIKPRPSLSNTFPNFLFPDHRFEANTNTHGEKRAFVVTGEYERVLPMDIYPQHLMKAIMANDFEKMEGLGIFELTEEDLALCEFACTSKAELQKTLRQGLNLMREQI